MPEPDANQPAESLRQAPTDDARGCGSDADVWRARYEALEGTIPVRLMHRYGAWVERVAPTGKLRRRLGPPRRRAPGSRPRRGPGRRPAAAGRRRRPAGDGPGAADDAAARREHRHPG